MYALGLDIGSTATKGVVLNCAGEIISTAIVSVGTGTTGPARVMQKLYEGTGIIREDVGAMVVTGYGRMKYDEAGRQVSELSCHAKGAAYLMPTAGTVIDIGGQDIKALQLGTNGKLINFLMNDKCAAGTGRFLDVMAKVLEVAVADLGMLSSQAAQPVPISNTCTVFAESEVISHLSNHVPTPDIVAGIHLSVAKRVAGLVKRLGVWDDVIMVGGVAQNTGIVESMEKILGKRIQVPVYAQLTGALGAALYAREALDKSQGGI